MRRYRQAILSVLITLLLLSLVWLTNRDNPTVMTRPIIRMTRTVSAGAAISAADISVITLPDDPALVDYASDPAAVIGQAAQDTLAAGELLSSAHIGPQAKGLVYPQAGPGRRIMSLKLTPEDANGYWLAAGNRVDLYVVPQGPADTIPAQVVRDIRVMALLNQDGTALAGLAGSVTQTALICLDVSDEEAVILATAESQADIKIVVINEPDSGGLSAG